MISCVLVCVCVCVCLFVDWLVCWLVFLFFFLAVAVSCPTLSTGIPFDVHLKRKTIGLQLPP
jgi:hypothetical protein